MVRLVVCGFLFLALVGLAAGGAAYAITADPGVNTPNTTVELGGSTFTVRGIGVIPPGDTITASVSVPGDNDGYRVYIYGTVDGNRELIDSKYASSGSSVAFETSGFDPGLYTFALHTDGDYQAVYPFIVTGATVETTAPDTATVGNSVTLNADVTPTTPTVDIADVEFVIFGNGVQKRISASATASGYTATVEMDDLPAGKYTVYAAALNASQTATGDPEPIGLSAQQTLTIEEQSMESGSQQSTTTTPTENTRTTTTAGTATPTTTTPQPTATATPATTETTTAPTETSPPPTTARSSTTDSDVRTPNPTTTTSTSAPGFSISASIVALLAAVGFWRRLTERNQP